MQPEPTRAGVSFRAARAGVSFGRADARLAIGLAADRRFDVLSCGRVAGLLR